MNKPTLYTLVISLIVVAIGVIMWVCGQFYRHTFIGETLNIIGGLIFSLGLTLIPIIGYCVKMSMEKNKARREQTDTNNGLDPQNYAATTNANANENYRVAVTNHLLQVCIKFLICFLPSLKFLRNN